MIYFFENNISYKNQKIEITEDELILSECVSRQKEVEVLRFNYKNISSIHLVTTYIKTQYPYWDYSCIITQNDEQQITIYCERELYHQKQYIIFLNYLHAYCSSYTHIQYMCMVTESSKYYYSLDEGAQDPDSSDIIYGLVLVALGLLLFNIGLPSYWSFTAFVVFAILVKLLMKNFLEIEEDRNNPQVDTIKHSYNPTKLPSNMIPLV